MRDVTAKPATRRVATAEAFLAIPPEAQILLRERRTEKGDAIEVARAAGIMGAKRTWELLPFCHPIPVTHVAIGYDYEDGGVRVTATVKSIAPTGVEMEALTAVSITVLTLYDMLKPHTQDIQVRDLQLVSKKGGKSDFREVLDPPVRAAVVVLSDSVAAGKKEDRAGKAVFESLAGEASIAAEFYEVLPDDPDQLRARAQALVAQGFDLLITVGGTGLSATDRTVEALQPLIDREVPGVMEAARAYGQQRTLYAMLSRGIAGMIGDTLVLTFPGSTGGAVETYDALFPAVLHLFQMLRNVPHRHGYS